MPDSRVEFLDAVEEVMQNETGLDTSPLVASQRVDSIMNDMEDLQYITEQELYTDEDNRGVAYDAVQAINRAVGKLRAIEKEIYLKV